MQTFLDWITQHQQIIYIVILMIFVGIEVIGHVPSVLHTPLMSGANAIHGVVIIGAIIVMGKAEQDNYLALILGFLAVVLGTINVVGGFAGNGEIDDCCKCINVCPWALCEVCLISILFNGCIARFQNYGK